MAQASMSVRTSVSTTPQNSSPCSSPTCGYCQSDASLIDSPQMSPWSTIPSPPASPSAQAVYAAMLAAEAPPPEDHESSSLVTEMMAAARAKAGYVPRTSYSEPEGPLALTPEQLDFDTRVEAAIAKSSALIAEAKTQLAAPIIAPAELTDEEKAEAQRNAAWDVEYEAKNEAVDQAMARNQALFEDVMPTIDDMEAQGISMPDCGDLLTWESNAGFAGTKSKTAAKWSVATAAAVVSPPDEVRQNAPSRASHTAGKQKDKSRDRSPEWRNVFKWDFCFTW